MYATRSKYLFVYYAENIKNKRIILCNTRMFHSGTPLEIILKKLYNNSKKGNCLSVWFSLLAFYDNCLN